MPIKDPIKAREYKRLWMANKRKQQKSVEPVEPPTKNVEPSAPRGKAWFKCYNCPNKILYPKKYAPDYINFSPICEDCLPR